MLPERANSFGGAANSRLPHDSRRGRRELRGEADETLSQPATIDLVEAASPQFLAELSLACLEHELRANAELAALPTSRTLALLLALHPEVVRLSVLSAACVSVANAVAYPERRSGAAPKPRSLLHTFPSESSRYILAASRLRRATPDSQAGKHLDAINDALGGAIAATIEFAASGFELGAGGRPLRERVAEAWRSVCVAEIGLLEAIRNELMRYRLAASDANSAALLSALREGARGATPFLMASGEIQLPQWAELRRSQRLPVNIRADMLCRGREQKVRITDISTGGAGIEFTETLQQQDEVTLVVDMSMVMSGRVVWVRARHAGIEFDQPFYEDTLELRFLKRTAQTER